MRAGGAASCVRPLFELLSGERIVEALVAAVSTEPSAISQQLRVLSQLRFVTPPPPRRLPPARRARRRAVAPRGGDGKPPLAEAALHPVGATTRFRDDAGLQLVGRVVLFEPAHPGRATYERRRREPGCSATTPYSASCGVNAR